MESQQGAGGEGVLGRNQQAYLHSEDERFREWDYAMD
jgi:hypothetical protein